MQTLAVFDSRMVDAPSIPDLPAQIPMQSVPTGVVAHDGAYFVSELTGFPFQIGAARVHRVVPGNYLGTSDGKVIDISASKIQVIEIVPDGLGGYMERPAALALNE